jgi:cobalt-zinc-cadmium resistance protein CzcA
VTSKPHLLLISINTAISHSICSRILLQADVGLSEGNVGGRTINFGQQSVNVRGVGLFDDGGDTNVVDGYHVRDIENVVLNQTNGVPVMVKDVAKVYVGYLPRLGIAGRDDQNDVVTAIVVMNRTLHTNDVVPRIEAAIEKLNSDGSLPPGVKLIPFYDRSTLVSVTVHTVVHNLVFGCLLVFFIQWIFLGNLRSAIIVGVNIPFALFFSIIILVLLGEDANLLSIGAVDFGIIVDSAVILVENVFRNLQAGPAQQGLLLQSLAEHRWGSDPTVPRDGEGHSWTDRLRLILISALEVDRAVFFSAALTVAAFIPLFTMQGVEGQIFSPMARTYGYALAGALIATFTVTPCLASYVIPENLGDTEPLAVRVLHAVYAPVLRWSLGHGARGGAHSRRGRPAGPAARHRVPAAPRRRQPVDPRSDAADHLARSRESLRQQDPRNHPPAPGGRYRGLAARAARQRQRCRRVLQR